ncbi:sensor histidine kinase [Maribacter sp. 2307ULW6-5]|uniref:sensor histidine kinase n=1 Tax=Maribacter sp. 2307ULW6-5 TaxID=3386275 RepID=UPI0039BC3AD6
MYQIKDDTERLKNKVRLVQNLNYVSGALSIIFGLLCYFALGITHIVPHAFVIFGVLNLINTLAYQKHRSYGVLYLTASTMALITSFIITLYTGGINSAFIFTLALIVFAAYMTTRRFGQIYLNFIFLLVIFIFSQSIPDFSFVENVVPEGSRNIFNLCSVLFSFYLLGNVFGKNLLNTHHKLYKSKMELEQQLQDKETHLMEVHHRVKNNLQTVSSLLSLQSRNMEDEKMKSIIKNTQNRVISMAMVHEMLYMRQDTAHIAYKTYVQELGNYLIRSIKGLENKVRLILDIQDVKLGIDTAIPLGLLINEALTNSLKYGLKDMEEGEIRIALKKEMGNGYLLTIGDNGMGFPDSITHKNTKSLGLKLINNLTRQLRGTIKKDPTKKGTHYIIRFQEITQQLSPVA